MPKPSHKGVMRLTGAQLECSLCGYRAPPTRMRLHVKMTHGMKCTVGSAPRHLKKQALVVAKRQAEPRGPDRFNIRMKGGIMVD